MSDLQEENKEEAEEKETEGSMGPYPQAYLEGKVGTTGWEVKLVKQDETSVIFKVFCRDEEREWFQLIAKVPKAKFKRIGA